jgi:hypothetical protein
MESLSHALHLNEKCISYLDLSDNLEITDAGIHHLTLALEERGEAMQCLLLSSVSMTTFGLVPLIQQGLKDAAHLSLLDVSFCCFGSCKEPASSELSADFLLPLSAIQEGDGEGEGDLVSESSFEPRRVKKSLMHTIEVRAEAVLAGSEAIDLLLTRNRRLSRLNLAHCEICVRGIERLSKSLREHAEWLEELDLSGNPFGPDGAAKLADSLFGIQKPNPLVSAERWRNIRHIPDPTNESTHSPSNPSSPFQSTEVESPKSSGKHWESLTSLSHRPSVRQSGHRPSQSGSTRLGDSGGPDMIQAGAPHPSFSLTHLRVLSLSSVNLTSYGFEDLMDALYENHVLQELDVSRNFIKTIDVATKKSVFHDFNSNNKSLHKLDLRWNQVPIPVCTQLKSFFSIDGKKKSLKNIKQESRLTYKALKEQVKEIFYLEEDLVEYELLA